ncbi:DNA-binding protein, partial [Mycobacteroides abscessus]
AAMLAPYGLPWPQDLVEDFMAGQRTAPHTAAAPQATVSRGQQAVRTFPTAATETRSNVIALSSRSRRG